MLFRYKQM